MYILILTNIFTQLFENAANVTTPIGLVAFIVAAVSLIYRNKLDNKIKLIAKAPKEERSNLIEAALETYNLKKDNLTREQKFILVNRVIEEKAKRFKIAANISLVLGTMLFVIILFQLSTNYQETKNQPDVSHITIMDSPLKDVVYDIEDWLIGKTNSEAIVEIIDDLNNIKINIEKTNLAWDGEERIYSDNPKLIIIHYSCFYDKTNLEDADRKFYSFLKYFGDLKTNFLIYSRGFHHNEESWKKNLIKTFPELEGRISTLSISPGKTFKDVEIKRKLRKQVKEILKYDL